MSRTRDDARAPSPGSNRAYLELSRMLQEGRSWSGRERNCCFLNTGGERFATISAASGLDFPDDGRATCTTDWDGDGDLDLWTSNRNAPRLRFLRNEAGAQGRSVLLQLRGDGVISNRDAVGASVEVVLGAGARPLRKTLRAGEGYLAQSSQRLHFGLGDAAAIEKVVVSWPGGKTEEIRGVSPGGSYSIAQGSGAARPASNPGRRLAIAPAEQRPPAPRDAARIPLSMLLRMPTLTFEPFEGPWRPLRAAPGKSLLIVLWASWCAPCLAELQELTRRRAELEAGGVEVMALATDGLGDDRSSPAAAEAALRKLQAPFVAGRATPPLVQLLQRLHDVHLPLHLPLPVPASFLVDSQGRLSVIYRGAASVDDILRDARRPVDTAEGRWIAAAALPGSIVRHPAVEEARRTLEIATRFQLAGDLTQIGWPDDAMAQYEDLLSLKQGFAEAVSNLGLLWGKKGEWGKARERYEEALRLRPDFAAAHFNLAAARGRQGDAARAQAGYRRTLELQPDYPGAHNALGLLLAQGGKLAEAAAAFAREIEVDPRSAEAHNHLGLLHLQRNDLTRAEPLLRRAVELDPKLADAHNNLGVLLKRQGKVDEAAAEYGQAIRIQPDFAAAHNNLGLAQMALGNLREAERCFDQALRAQPDFEAARQNLERVRGQAGR